MANIENKFSEILFKSMNNSFKSLGIKTLTKEEYIKSQKETKKSLNELAEKIKYCKEKGHVPKSEHISAGQNGTQVYGECKRCGMGYDRNLTSKEWSDFHKTMNTPMTI